MDLRIRRTNGQYSRFMVIDLNGTYWTGHGGWSYDQRDAALFETYEQAERELGRLLEQRGKTVHRFEAKVTVIVESDDEEIDVDSLALHLHMTSELQFNPALPRGYFVELVWGSLRKVEND